MKEPLLKQDKEYRQLSLEWEVPEAGDIAQIDVAEENGTVLYTYQTYRDYVNLKNILAYACQENDYSGPLVFRLTIKNRENGNVVLEWQSEAVLSNVTAGLILKIQSEVFNWKGRIMKRGPSVTCRTGA